jgi:hypothetical protein
VPHLQRTYSLSLCCAFVLPSYRRNTDNNVICKSNTLYEVQEEEHISVYINFTHRDNNVATTRRTVEGEAIVIPKPFVDNLPTAENRISRSSWLGRTTHPKRGVPLGPPLLLLVEENLGFGPRRLLRSKDNPRLLSDIFIQKFRVAGDGQLTMHSIVITQAAPVWNRTRAIQ